MDRENIKYYLLFNPQLKKLSVKELKESYMNDLKSNNKVISINSFFKKYPTFDINKYKCENKNIENYTMIETLVHYHLNEVDKEREVTHNNINNQLIEFEEQNIEKIIAKSQKSPIKLAHIFVHFFQIGGGECYLSTFNKYNKVNNTFEETLFININKRSETLFEYDGKVVYYNNYSQLNKLLDGFDIILDHQLYWFEENITIETFQDIPPNKIIRVIHGVPIHFKDITKLNFYYSIELYTEYLSDKSWNNHIKIYNNIGVKKNDTIERSRKFNEKDIHVAIVGRVNPEKIPTTFLKLLSYFSKNNFHYFFNFYGEIDSNYKNYFYTEISKIKNVKYHGIINPKMIDIIYLNNDLLLHPSKSEAGATVLLEAMSYGLPIICRNVGGIPNAVGDNNFLCNDENEMFKELLNININNYDKISKENIIKINRENDKEKQTLELINEIRNIYDIENESDNIPNIIHYIFGLKEQKEEFAFVYYLSILSNLLINKPKAIYFHYQYLPYGYWWDKAKEHLKLNYINTDDIYFGEKKIIKYAHKADKIRLDMLLKYGGIYMDIDTITYRPYHHLLKYDFCIGIQEEIYKNKRVEILYCNAILFSKRNNIFLKNWIDQYSTYFDPDGWCEASVHLPSIVYKKLDNEYKKNIKVLEKEAFYIPSYNEVHKIFEGDEKINNSLLTLHFWNTYSEKYYKEIQNFDWILNGGNSLYAKLINNIIKIN